MVLGIGYRELGKYAKFRVEYRIPNTEFMKKKEIKIRVGLDNKNVPEAITWKADDQEGPAQQCKAMLLALFDKKSNETLKIDLWTKEMQVNEMDRFFFQTLRALADTYYKATQNAELATDMQRFVQYFGEQTEIIPKSEG